MAYLNYSDFSGSPAFTAGPNLRNGTLDVPTGAVPPQMAKFIGAPLRPNWDPQPKTGDEWKPVADAGAAATIKNIPGMTQRLHVKVEKTTIDEVNAFILTPDVIAPENRNRLLIHVHGGCYVLNPGEAGLPEAVFKPIV